MLKENTHITIQSFMVNDLNLKGNELLIYAIIYGFSQDEKTKFSGSLQYLADWCNSTKQGVHNSLKNLIEKGLIEKEDKIINKQNFPEYYCVNYNVNHTTNLYGIQLSCINNNIYNNNNINNNKKIYKEGYNNINNIDYSYKLNNNKKIDNKDNNNTINYNLKLNNIKKDELRYIIDYLNYKSKKNYRYTNNNIKNIINRYNEGFKIEDFVKVIDIKTKEWLNDNKMNKFLRPETLFGNKFESYLNQSQCKRTLKDITMEELEMMKNE